MVNPDMLKAPATKNAVTGQPNPLATSLRTAIMGFRTTQLISVAAKLNLAEYLKDGPQTAEHLSQAVNAHPDSISRLLRALSSLGIFEQKDEGLFCNTPAAELLLDSTPGSLRSLAVLYGEDWLWQAYAGLPYSMESGKPAFEHVHGRTLYEYLEQNLTAASVFHKAMSGYSATEAESIIEAYDFSIVATIIDIGGGEGTFVSELLKANPHLSGIVFDLPAVIEKAQGSPGKEAGISYVYGDFFKEVPGGADVYLLKSVLHNWDDTSCLRILRNCRKVMGDEARLLIIERVIPSGGETSEATLFDINMLTMTGGRERTAGEYRALFMQAGFGLTRIIPTQSAVSIIEGLPDS